ncbi:hypothetical protein BKA70DRAFT_1422248 [Coprinopsis sp. MPI-PUGE-AT-0042]|nr:hypothetical protein BKA70DRAFT_1422248 [Coprinopsis sp. MPI-PUGE-AT-0042]
MRQCLEYVWSLPSRGYNIHAYGAMQQVPGNVTIGYTIDGNFSETVTLSPISPGANRTNWELNQRLFGHLNKAFYGDEKTLEVTVKEVTDDQKKPTTQGNSNTAAVSSRAQVQASKKKASLKAKASTSKSEKRDGHVLGGADYVSLMMGGRRKAREEAAKLPPPEDADIS